ncbi:hypothetical protein OUZ56_010348 [Daphnia magna]|uniref:Uncharacterized protein n=1 Tax=Daphnia magna TaxID=35525 RepID=A0ABR0AIQ3_9CRUS|nr:hypothetical protein OUZ56_010348 [Daphnia magna]
MKPRISSKWRDAVDVSLYHACSQSEGEVLSEDFIRCFGGDERSLLMYHHLRLFVSYSLDYGVFQ